MLMIFLFTCENVELPKLITDYSYANATLEGFRRAENHLPCACKYWVLERSISSHSDIDLLKYEDRKQRGGISEEGQSSNVEFHVEVSSVSIERWNTLIYLCAE